MMFITQICDLMQIYLFYSSYQWNYISIYFQQPKQRSLLSKKPRKTLTQAQLLEELDLPEGTFDAPPMMTPSPYHDFKHSLYNDGTILWRENTENKQVIVMNDYDSLTGIFKVWQCCCCGPFFANPNWVLLVSQKP